ncbi:MAG TPA: hypothetical protein VJ578_05150 [Dehalococcoidia bacterium]|nr:hypothetical protein [Dehalococcoidia bacterium]
MASALAAEHGWLDDALPDRFWRNCGLAAVAGGVMLLGVPGAIRLGAHENPFFGGVYPQALALPIAEAVIAVAVSLLALEWFRRRWDHAWPLARALGQASFAAYIVHAPVVVCSRSGPLRRSVSGGWLPGGGSSHASCEAAWGAFVPPWLGVNACAARAERGWRPGVPRVRGPSRR